MIFVNANFWIVFSCIRSALSFSIKQLYLVVLFCLADCINLYYSVQFSCIKVYLSVVYSWYASIFSCIHSDVTLNWLETIQVIFINLYLVVLFSCIQLYFSLISYVFSYSQFNWTVVLTYSQHYWTCCIQMYWTIELPIFIQCQLNSTVSTSCPDLYSTVLQCIPPKSVELNCVINLYSTLFYMLYSPILRNWISCIQLY